MSRTIFQSIAERAASRPGSIAIRRKGARDLTNAELLAAVTHVRHTMRGLGVARDGRIAIVAPNGSALAVTLLGVMGYATAAPLNPKYTAAEFEYYLSDVQAQAVIVATGYQSAVREAATLLGIQVIEMSEADRAHMSPIQVTAGAGGEAPAVSSSNFVDEASVDDLALVLHTSGTTSRPKLVPLTQANVLASASNITRTLRLTPHDCCLNIMPLFHIHGIVAGLLSPIVSGGSTVCAPGLSDDPFFLAQFPSWLQEVRPSWYTAVPSMHQAILGCARRYPDVVAQCQLRFIRSSSAPLAPQVMTALETAFKAPVIEAYGMTEAAHQVASNPLPPAARKPGSVGLPAGPTIAIMDSQGGILEAGQRGEIVIRGNNVITAYENNEAANRDAFADGWFRTGDEGTMDNDGYLFITGRLKELINRGGEKIAPREIDEALLAHPAVLQAAAFAFPHPTLDEVPAAAVVLREGHEVGSRTLQDFVAEKLAPFKVPNPIFIVHEIPKGPTGKLQRAGLAAKLNDKGKA